MDESFLRAQVAAKFLEEHTKHRPKIGVVLGSGLGDFAQYLNNPVTLEYRQIPGMPVSSVSGHQGAFVSGEVGDMPVMLMSGRVHLYEGHSAQDVVLGIRIMAALGISSLILTNAAGAIFESFSPGQLMLIRDHINLTGTNCLLGSELQEGVGKKRSRFVDMTDAYDPSFRDLAKRVAVANHIALQEGVYAGLLGPSYETPAEIHMLRTWGADAVGMSTVLETIAARHLGLRVMGLSCLTNMAAGILESPLSHQEVKEVARAAQASFSTLLRNVIEEMGKEG